MEMWERAKRVRAKGEERGMWKRGRGWRKGQREEGKEKEGKGEKGKRERKAERGRGGERQSRCEITVLYTFSKTATTTPKLKLFSKQVSHPRLCPCKPFAGQQKCQGWKSLIKFTPRGLGAIAGRVPYIFQSFV